jgi:protein disulfide-isomerase
MRHPLIGDYGVNANRILRLAAALLAIGLASARADSASWQTDFKKAQEEAKASNKLLFIDFTGSDWCGYCKMFDRDILSKPSFKDYASKNLVLLEVDFPRMKELSRETRMQNEKLATEYQIEGFPTGVVLNGNGQKVWRFDGYYSDGADAFIAELEKLRKG